MSSALGFDHAFPPRNRRGVDPQRLGGEGSLKKLLVSDLAIAERNLSSALRIHAMPCSQGSDHGNVFLRA